MAYPDRDFLPGRRVVLTGAAAAVALPATAWAEIPKSLVTGAMARFKPARPPKPMPDLEFLDADDKPLRLANLTGKARLINLWATWCAPCVKEMPSLDRLQAALPRDKFVVLPISLDGPSKAKVAPFYKKQGLTNLGIYYDKGRKAMSVLDVSLLPTSILVDPAGRELGRIEGDADWDTPEGIVVIPGASSGIGLALARAFAKEGNALLLIARHMKPVDGLPADRTEYAEADVADYPALERAIRDAEQKFGKTACLINSAGMADARAFTDVEPEAFSHEIDVNLKGTLNATKVVIGDMQAAKSGTIINISSVSDRKTSPVAVGYTASKYAVRAAGESLREAVGMQGVRVINVAPAYIKTNIHKGMGISFDEYCRLLGNPDFLEAEELAEIVLYCWKLPPTICIRDIVVAPTRSGF